MKKFTLKVFAGAYEPIIDIVEAEAHTLDNGMIIFWVTIEEGAWAQVALYPASCTAIIRVEEVNPIVEIPSQMTNMPINITADVQKVIREIKDETKVPKKPRK